MEKATKGAFLALLILLAGFALGVGSNWLCTNYQDVFCKDECVIENDSATTPEIQANVLEKTYVCVTDVLSDHRDLVVQSDYIDKFKSMSTETVKNVVNVLLWKRSCITIQEIVDEYEANSEIYNNIKPNSVADPTSVAESESKTLTELSALPQDSSKNNTEQ